MNDDVCLTTEDILFAKSCILIMPPTSPGNIYRARLRLSLDVTLLTPA